jgi:hypothetical protein
VIPELSFHRPIAKCSHKQLADFVTFKSDKVPVRGAFVELRTKIQNMDLCIEAFQNDKIFLAQEIIGSLKNRVTVVPSRQPKYIIK